MCGHQRFDISTATNLRGIRCRSAWSAFCPFTIWRGIAQERRGPNRRPSDGKIKGARCGPVGRRKSEEVSAACNEVHFWLAACDFPQAFASSWIPAPRRACEAMVAWKRATAGPLEARQGSRCARPAPPACGLDRPPAARLFCFQAIMACRERERSRRDTGRNRGLSVARRGLRPFCGSAVSATLAPWLASRNRGDSARPSRP